MNTSLLALAPFIPSDHVLVKSDLPDKVMELTMQSAKLSGQLAPLTFATLTQHMQIVNSYYSNLIEGNPTRPYEIRAAHLGNFNNDSVKRDLQLESVGHIAVQAWLHNQSLDLDRIFSPDFIQEVHKKFYHNIPESLWIIKDDDGKEVGKVVPGEWRLNKVIVGRHIAPNAEGIADLMGQYCKTYHPKIFKGDRKLIAVMAAHHRFAFIHPFADGNGRVGRLLTDAALKAVGLDSYGSWCVSRGLAKTSAQYKSTLAGADSVRQGDHDGRGALTEKGLLTFCDYMLDTAIDQVTYISNLLGLEQFRTRIDSYIQARNDFRVEGMTDGLKKSAGLLLYNAFIHGELERSQALELCAMPERSARRLLSQLKKEGLLSETSSKSPLKWEIPEHAEAWYFPNLAPLK
ncbi:MAG: Fic family protein [Methylococcaceae bacterium]|nr:Fic family protein [Methylococcaceae bacterium]